MERCDASKSRWSEESDPLLRGDAALREVLHAFAGHRLLARLLLVEALGAGKEFNAKLNELHAAFAALIADCLDAAVAEDRFHQLTRGWRRTPGTAPSTMSSCAGC